MCMKNQRIDIASIRRAEIVEAAVAVIAEKGLQNLSLSQIEKKAGMSRGQLTYYFPTKEDLVFHRMEAFEEELLRTIRERPQGESIVQAFGRFVIKPRGFLASRR